MIDLVYSIKGKSLINDSQIYKRIASDSIALYGVKKINARVRLILVLDGAWCYYPVFYSLCLMSLDYLGSHTTTTAVFRRHNIAKLCQGLDKLALRWSLWLMQVSY
ncbi:MAG: hypothetical protein KME25_28580 [Symplocastrum torsivum CPER-KK1]|jgi:hypothetical protein|uniref:Uncharacterized protein n=1 Tax=Symplocastrum torsivum CPER-KK1 TaxID=450513 RepID=A0A951PT98_9CYAN|nr:hypothetical protein [Symplocastrum torsivum CPER-KK1]